MSSAYFVNAVMYVDYKGTINYHENRYKDMIKQCLNRINIAYIVSQISYIKIDAHYKSNLSTGSSYRRLIKNTLLTIFHMYALNAYIYTLESLHTNPFIYIYITLYNKHSIDIWSSEVLYNVIRHNIFKFQHFKRKAMSSYASYETTLKCFKRY